ncbi:GNAT family N-acetyltransferase [Halalkalicoccus sp. NIPERK01]|uniref:lipid II:glycine glycyltransferase FemX n=1 Tax=Halalkalicoccus sp. NIPERK01 TaxID=3053469 RepID=UPI00256ECB0D|nr:GNAT family N-acetyltransferase [Halalkalicoccus sp. NIPERK01]MDL5361205.1 GNAT family N-acetyltransferase [Halalkalicoccus sp. NIPERK01]
MIAEYTLRPANETEWERFVGRRANATVFHTLGWKRAVESAFGYTPRYRLVAEGDRTVAAVPGFEVPSLFGTTVTTPFGEYGFPLIEGESEPVLAALAEATSPFETLVLKESNWSGTTGYSAAGFGGIETGIALQLDVDRPFEAVRETSFTSGARRNVRKAREEGVVVTEAETVEPYYRLYLATMRRLGSPPFPADFFEALRRELAGNVTLLLAKHEGTAIAGLLAFEYGDRCLIWGNASNPDAWDLKPNDLLYAEIVERACESAASVVDFGRNERGSNVHEFKTEFGGEEAQLTSLVYPPDRTGRASIEAYKRAAPLARRVGPIVANRTVGPCLKWWIHE